MKILTWFLVIFSGLGVLGLLFATEPDTTSLWGLVYGGLVIAQGVMVLMHLNKEEKNIN